MYNDNNKQINFFDEITFMQNRINHYRDSKYYCEDFTETLMMMMMKYIELRTIKYTEIRTITHKYGEFKMLVSPKGTINLQYRLVNIIKNINIDTKDIYAYDLETYFMEALEEIYNWKEIDINTGKIKKDNYFNVVLDNY